MVNPWIAIHTHAFVTGRRGSIGDPASQSEPAFRGGAWNHRPSNAHFDPPPIFPRFGYL